MRRLLRRGSSISITTSLGRAFRAAWPTMQSRAVPGIVRNFRDRLLRACAQPSSSQIHHRLNSRLTSVLFCSIHGRLRCTPFGSSVARTPSHGLTRQKEAGVVLGVASTSGLRNARSPAKILGSCEIAKALTEVGKVPKSWHSGTDLLAGRRRSLAPSNLQ